MMFIYDHVFLPTTNNLFLCLPMCVNKFRTPQSQYMLFWLLKDAHFACKRCPFEVYVAPS